MTIDANLLVGIKYGFAAGFFVGMVCALALCGVIFWKFAKQTERSSREARND
jgi:hypothetical protein